MFFAREREASRVFLSPEIRDGGGLVVVLTIFGSGFGGAFGCGFGSSREGGVVACCCGCCPLPEGCRGVARAPLGAAACCFRYA